MPHYVYTVIHGTGYDKHIFAWDAGTEHCTAAFIDDQEILGLWNN
jgi:hypothetical protein